jgi:hypothetical protein
MAGMKYALLAWCAWSWFSAIAGLWALRKDFSPPQADGLVSERARDVIMTVSIFLTIVIAPVLEVVRIYLIVSRRKK